MASETPAAENSATPTLPVVARPAATLALALALTLVGIAAWWIQLRPPLLADTELLLGLPTRLGAWESIDLPMEDAVESMLRADANLQRAYVHPLGDVVWLYVGYYGTERGGTPEHQPRACYTAHGWNIIEQRIVEIDPVSGLRANEYLVEQDGDSRLVQFWFRSYRDSSILGQLSLQLDHVYGQLADMRADGALVRISTPVLDGSIPASRSRLADFAVRLEPALGVHWPTERSAEGAG